MLSAARCATGQVRARRLATLTGHILSPHTAATHAAAAVPGTCTVSVASSTTQDQPAVEYRGLRSAAEVPACVEFMVSTNAGGLEVAADRLMERYTAYTLGDAAYVPADSRVAALPSGQLVCAPQR